MAGKDAKSNKSSGTISTKSKGSKLPVKINDSKSPSPPLPPKKSPQSETLRQTLDEANPGFYALPSTIGFIEHDPTKRCQPAFTIATVRESKSRKKSLYDVVPGPKYNFWDVTRFGAIPQTGAILTSRHQAKPDTKDTLPGPGRYAPEQHESPGHKKAPEPRILGRTEPKMKHHLTPSPGQYLVPTTLGESHPVYICAPSATINGRSWDKLKPGEKNLFSPGPNQYFNYELETFYKSSPSARIIGRVKNKYTVGPGPGKYNADYIQGPEGPSFSFGVRHSKKACVLSENDEY